MDASSLAEFFFNRLKEVTELKDYIAEVHFSFSHMEAMGEEYINLRYNIIGNDRADTLDDATKQVALKKSYKFLVAGNTQKAREDEKRRLLRIVEFQHLYTSLTSYAVLQLREHLNPETTVKVDDIYLWPVAGYAEKYMLTYPSEVDSSYFKVMQSNWGSDYMMFAEINEWAEKSKKIYKKEKEQFKITDIEINKISGLRRDLVHRILLQYEVPIKLKGTRTVDEALIHVGKLAEAIEQVKEDAYNYNKEEWTTVLTHLKDTYLK
jgi:hypothetical protein